MLNATPHVAYQDRQILKPYLGQPINNITGIIIATNDNTRLNHQVVIASVNTPYGQLDHLALNLDANQRRNLALFYPVKFNAKVNHYRHFIGTNKKVSDTYGLIDINHFRTINQLPNTDLTSYQENQCRRYHINFNTVLKLPNNGEREQYLHQIKQQWQLRWRMNHHD